MRILFIAFCLTLCGGLGHTTTSNEVLGVMHISDMPLSVLFPSNFPIEGNFSGEAILSGSFDAPEVEIKGYFLVHYLPNLPARGEFSLSLKQGEVSSSGTLFIEESGFSPLTFNCSFLASCTLFPFSFHVEENAPLKGVIQGHGDLAKPLQLLTDSRVLLSGLLNYSLILGGTYQKPLIQGMVELKQGMYEIPEIGALVTDLTAQIEGKNDALIIKSLEGKTSNGGSITGTGKVALEPRDFELNLELHQALLLNLDDLYAVCSGPLTFSGKVGDAALLKGDLTINEGAVLISDGSRVLAESVEVTFLNAPDFPSMPPKEELKWPIGMDIALAMAKPIPVEGDELHSLWEGSFLLKGEVETPELYGEATLISGYYLFNGNRFDLKKGNVTFAGDLKKNGSLYVIASRDLGKVDVDIIVRGSFDNPALSFRSTPPLPQREILSWILFNRGSSEINTFQGAQLNESITNLKGFNQGPDVLSKVRSTLGIDTFEICPSSSKDNCNLGVQVGKYISEGLLVSIVKSDVNRLAVEAAITNRIRLQAQVGDDTEGQLLLKWKRNY